MLYIYIYLTPKIPTVLLTIAYHSPDLQLGPWPPSAPWKSRTWWKSHDRGGDAWWRAMWSVFMWTIPLSRPRLRWLQMLSLGEFICCR